MMKPLSQKLIFLSVLLLASLYVLPLWQIVLEAPQYPEGLNMKIWLTGLTGNIEQINGLNHYIGMKHIRVEDFWEFKIVPYLFGVIILLGFIAAWKKSRKWLWIYVISLVVFAIVGFTDFYLWEYDYGHNLDPHAAIKIEGMTYQPPLFGYKQLLNFLAGSMPDIGGIVAGIGGFIAVGVLFFEQRLAKKSK